MEYNKITEIVKNKIFNIKVVTKSSKNEVFLENDIIKVKITEIPENGKANKAIIDLLSKTFKISKNKISIISGLKSSNKTIKID